MILYDLSALGNPHKTGIPNYVLQLGRALLKREQAYCGFFLPNKVLSPQASRHFVEHWTQVMPGTVEATLAAKVQRRLRRYASASAQPALRLYRRWENKSYLEQHRPRLQHFTSHEAREAFDLPVACTLCDLSPYSHPELHDERNLRRFRNTIEQLEAWRQQGRPVRIPVISEFTRREVERFAGPGLAALCRVTYLGFDQNVFYQDPASVRQDRILAVGTLEPRKNLTLLLQAFATFGLRHKGVMLTLVGARGWKNEAFDSAIARHPLRDRIEVKGFVSDAELGALYRESSVFCYPSMLEGFGLPPLEAMACGAPVVLSNASSLPEVGGEAAIYCDPRDAQGLDRALEQAFDERAVRSALGLAQSQKFSWDKCADDTLKVYAELADLGLSR